MLVVIAIVSLLLAVGIPSFIRLGNTQNLNMASEAHNLHSLLRAARQYAVTYNVNAGIAYVIDNRIDSVTGDPTGRDVLGGYGLVRGMTREEQSLLFQDGLVQDRFQGPNRDYVYFPVLVDHARFREMDASVCVQDGTNGWDTEASGLFNVVVLDPETFRPFDAPHTGGASNPAEGLFGNGSVEDAFPAHIFTPDGFMLPPTAARLRYEIKIGPSPDETIIYRESESGEAVEPVIVELKATLGQVRVVS
jgi:type II secretory pathway pseudopilin PulG